MYIWVKNISFIKPILLEDIENPNIDVFVELEDGYTHTMVVATCQNILSLMDKEKMDFSEPGCPFTIVRKLMKEVIEEAIKAYAEYDLYWLKLYHFAGDINMTAFNKLQAEHIEEFKEFDNSKDFHRNEN